MISPSVACTALVQIPVFNISRLLVIKLPIFVCSVLYLFLCIVTGHMSEIHASSAIIILCSRLAQKMVALGWLWCVNL